MRKAVVIAMAVLLLCQGCVIEKINGTEHLVKIGAPQNSVLTISQIDAIVPRFEIKDGHVEFSLTARGIFTLSSIQRYEIHKVGNQYRAIGLFPGFEHYCEVLSIPEGGSYEETNYAWAIAYPFAVGIGNCILGLPTLGTIFESIDYRVAKRSWHDIFYTYGIVGTYKYESDNYDINTGRYKKMKEEQRLTHWLLKNYSIRIGGQEYENVDGIVKIPFVPEGTIMQFQLLSIPANVKGCKDCDLNSILRNEYIVHCTK